MCEKMATFAYIFEQKDRHQIRTTDTLSCCVFQDSISDVTTLKFDKK